MKTRLVRVIFAEVDLGMQGLPMVDMISLTPALWMTSFATSVVAKVAQVTVAGVVKNVKNVKLQSNETYCRPTNLALFGTVAWNFMSTARTKVVGCKLRLPA